MSSFLFFIFINKRLDSYVRIGYNIFVVSDNQFNKRGLKMKAIEIRNIILNSDLTTTDLCTLNDAINTVRARLEQEVVVNQRVKWTWCKLHHLGTVQSITSGAVQVLDEGNSQLWWVPTDILQVA
jgi:hypothetical protein